MSLATMYMDLSLFTKNQKLSIPKKKNKRMKYPQNLVSPLSPLSPLFPKSSIKENIIERFLKKGDKGGQGGQHLILHLINLYKIITQINPTILHHLLFLFQHIRLFPFYHLLFFVFEARKASETRVFSYNP